MFRNGSERADKHSMSPIGNLPSYLQSVFTGALQSVGLAPTKTANNSGSESVSSLAQQPDSGQLSPFAQLASTLQQLQQSDPAKYQQVTQQIATNLQNAAQTAQADRNTTAANQLNQLSADFTAASKTGQLPNFQDLAMAASGHHPGHHHHAAASSDADASTSSTSAASGTNSSAGSTNQNLSQFLSSLQTNGTQTSSLDPTSIILSTLSNAGISVSNS